MQLERFGNSALHSIIDLSALFAAGQRKLNTGCVSGFWHLQKKKLTPLLTHTKKTMAVRRKLRLRAAAPMMRRRVNGKHSGKGFLDFLKKTKLLSRAGKVLGSIGVPYAGAIGSAAGMFGHGRRRR